MDSLIIFLSGLIFSLLLVPLSIKVARHIGAIDTPNARKLHKVPTPRLGGLGVYLSFLLSVLLFGNFSRELMVILIASFILFLLGIIDDINSVPAKKKFLVQLLVAFITVYFGKLLISELSIFGLVIDLSYWAYPITIIFLVAIINVMNLIDGLDGLASGLSIIYFLSIIIISLFQKRNGTMEIFLATSMLGITLGMLRYNFPPAKTFLGDSGSTFLGYIIGIISIIGFKGIMFSGFAVPLMLIAIPIMDTLFAIIRRILKGMNPFDVDKEHIHHQLLKYNNSVKTTLCLIYLIAALFSASSIITIIKSKKIGIILYIVLVIIILTLILLTDIISPKMNLKNKKNKEEV